MIVEIPDTTGHTPDVRPYLRRFSDELNLQRLEQGVDSFELRFNTRIGVLKCGFGQLLVIKKKTKNGDVMSINILFMTSLSGARKTGLNFQSILYWFVNASLFRAGGNCWIP